jgi:hypothetical protein
LTLKQPDVTASTRLIKSFLTNNIGHGRTIQNSFTRSSSEAEDDDGNVNTNANAAIDFNTNMNTIAKKSSTLSASAPMTTKRSASFFDPVQKRKRL